ncbi:MAG TPA: gluconolaconase, partial [Pantoea sp.]|nr:gluconolaconase [Pantoea sp.]
MKTAAALSVALAIGSVAAATHSSSPLALDQLAQDRAIGKPEVVTTFNGAMPTGVTVTREGRIFVNFPR